MSVKRIVTRPRGTWKWQDAYGVVEYRLRMTKLGRWVWTSWRTVVEKSTMSQLKRLGYDGIRLGSLHNRPYRCAYEEELEFDSQEVFPISSIKEV